MSSHRTALMPNIANNPVVLTVTSNSIQHRLIVSMRTGDQPPLLEVGRSIANDQLSPGLVDDVIAALWVSLGAMYLNHFPARLPDDLIDWQHAPENDW